MPNALSFFRVASAISLLFIKPFSLPFWIIYSFAGASDVLDGYLARK